MGGWTPLPALRQGAVRLPGRHVAAAALHLHPALLEQFALHPQASGSPRPKHLPVGKVWERCSEELTAPFLRLGVKLRRGFVKTFYGFSLLLDSRPPKLPSTERLQPAGCMLQTMRKMIVGVKASGPNRGQSSVAFVQAACCNDGAVRSAVSFPRTLPAKHIRST